ncbi:HsdR family type I site-specific deoxyribonuclease [Flavonifractor plautii]|uniref:type I restriction endonuclease subunit R n=1 Tax=Flavonifractor plautii TaxID=292800 RepID=UPI0006C7A6A9|nr:HsdR family type I site-specific deoxyribonuclease [Flavonifractor plautii]MBM6790845.1 HsdR family type I site-specific deoxyribonuclease [Flavonifractor plautii]MDU3013031.1 HsdR family type I site-specific deoxyribonuclease [Flavonifractor plautii]
MSIGQREKATQKRVINLFVQELGYTYLGDFTERKNSNIETELLTKFLTGKGYSPVLISRALKELQNAAGDQSVNLYDLNEQTYKKLRYGVKVSESVGQHKTTVQFVDWEHPLENDFYIAEEVTIKHKRPDLVLYINGIAFAVIELKRSTVSMSEGIRQNLTNQRPDMIMQFFATIGLVLAGNDSEGARYGTAGTQEKYYLSWKEDPNAKDEVSVAVRAQIEKYPLRLDKNLISLCRKERLAELLYNFIVFDSGRKKTCRPNQFFGNMAARDFVRRHEGGIIWHTQGSGKSLTMVWLSKWIKENISDSRILIITDRDELDVQIEQVFAGVNESIVRIRRGSELIQKINDTSPVMMCSLIHKFGKKNRSKSGETDYTGFIEELKRSLPENFSPKGDFYVFVDECHRTQSGKLHKAMETILPKATFIGFTGTPLMKKDKETSLEVFGPYIHRYKFDEAVRDKVVLDLRYEAREVEQNVVQQDRIDAWFEAKTRGLTNVAKAKLKQRWGNLQKMFSSKARLGQIVADIVFDMETKPRLHDGRGNAMLVAGSIYQACKFYELFQETELKGKCAIVTSYEPTVGDIRTETVGDDGETEAVEQYEIYMKMLGGKDPKAFEKEVKEKFIKQPEQMKLLIVVDKLLTGFDAPHATYLYIDKSMRDHGLFQAICRVNRLDGEDKEFGYIIDYKDLFRSLENAVADYTSEAFDCYDKEDVSGLLTDRLDKAKEQLEDSLEALRALCESVTPPKDMVDYYHYFCGADTEAFDLDELEENMPKREQLYNLSATALRAFGEVSGELQEKYHYTVEQIKALEREVTYYIKVRDDVRLASGDYVDLKKYDPDMRHLIDTYLSADPSRVLTSFGGATLVELLVDNGISALKDMPASTPKEQEAVAETIENNIGKEIVERTQSNPKYYEKMSALLRELIEKRKNDVINYEEYLRQIVELARKVHKPESGTEYPPEIRESAAKRAFYDHLNGDTVVANQIYDAVMSSKQDNFRGSKIKERKIWRAIRAVVKDDQEADQLLALVKEQSEF